MRGTSCEFVVRIKGPSAIVFLFFFFCPQPAMPSSENRSKPALDQVFGMDFQRRLTVSYFRRSEM